MLLRWLRKVSKIDWLIIYNIPKKLNLKNINLTVVIFKKFFGGMPPNPPIKCMLCTSPVMSDHDNMSDQIFVWTDTVSDHFKIIIIVYVLVLVLIHGYVVQEQ